MTAIEEIFSAISSYSKSMGRLQNDLLDIFARDIQRFEEMTGNLYNQMQWQAWSVVALTSLSGSLSIAGACIPKAADAVPSANPRLNANDGITDAISDFVKVIGDKLSDNEFLKSTCQTVSQTLNGFQQANGIWAQSKSTDMESKRELIRLCYGDARDGKGNFSREMTKAQDLALSIVQSKSKGG